MLHVYDESIYEIKIIENEIKVQVRPSKNWEILVSFLYMLASLKQNGELDFRFVIWK